MLGSRGQAEFEQAQERAQRATQMARAVMSTAAPAFMFSDPLDRLERAAERHRHGTLTEADLAAEQARIRAEAARRGEVI